MEAMRIAGVSSPIRYELIFDEYIPLRARSYTEPIGAALLRLGDYSRTLVELAIQPHSQVIRGLTLTSLATLDGWPMVSVARSRIGCPLLSTTFTDRQIIDLPIEFKVAVRNDDILIFWGELESCESYDCDRVRFLGSRGALAGVWFVQITAAEKVLFHTAASV